jgi:endonuclease/exonuclease/phosphatase (EEP) superfamily protein YafD
MQALRQATRHLIVSATLIYCIGLLALATLWASVAPQPWWLAITSVFALLLFAPLLLLIPAALVIRSWWMRSAVAVALLLFLALFGARFLPRSAPPSGGTAIRVMTFNQLFTNQRSADVIKEVRVQNPDVVGFQEFSPLLAAAVQKDLIGAYPYQYLDPGNQSGLGLLSRYPLLTTREPDTAHGQRVTIQLGGRIVTILSMHLTAPSVKSRKLWSLPIATGYDASAPTQQLDRLVREVDSINGPLIVMGDFNTSDREPRYAQLAVRMHDAFRETNWGFGFTFPDHKSFGSLTIPVPLIRIDYIWSKGGILPVASHVECNSSGADHCFLVADLQVGSADSLRR